MHYVADELAMSPGLFICLATALLLPAAFGEVRGEQGNAEAEESGEFASSILPDTLRGGVALYAWTRFTANICCSWGWVGGPAVGPCCALSLGTSGALCAIRSARVIRGLLIGQLSEVKSDVSAAAMDCFPVSSGAGGIAKAIMDSLNEKEKK